MPATRTIWSALTITLCVGLQAGSAAAATVPAGFSDTRVADGLANPTAMAFAPDGRLFVCEQSGPLRIIKNGVLLPDPFVTVAVNASGERGLLGVTFDPDFATNHFVYVYYTATTPTIHNRVSRFVANGDVAAPGEDVLLNLEPLGATNHNGGAIHFGPDGKLYVAVGDNAVRDNAQTLTNRLGKILRLNPDGSIPDDNPFFTVATGANRAIWALGLRNPYTFAFQDLSGRMLINDVGESTWEEVDPGVPGANYGWPATEGPTTNPAFVSPVHAYRHTGSVCAISGGAFHGLSRSQFPAGYWGTYFFADFCAGWIRVMPPQGAANAVGFARGISRPVDLQWAPDGSLYYLARGSGATTGHVGRISYTAGAPAIDLSANGSDDVQRLSDGMPLTLDMRFAAGTTALPAAQLYVGVQTPSAVFYLDQTGTFVPRVVPTYTGPLPTFGPSPLLRLPDVSALAPGVYIWFVLVDQNVDGVFSPSLSDFVATEIR
jgi:glucose/arabinose dehydrogenase